MKRKRPAKMNQRGERFKKRRQMNIRLKKLWEDLGITSCELRLPGCMRNWAMSAAHSKKSRFLITDEDWMEAALACAKCHETIEAWSHEKMFDAVTSAIAKRQNEAY